MVGVDVLGEVVQRENTGGVYEQRVSHAPDDGEGLRRGHAYPDGRMGLLVGLGPDRQVVALVMVALEGELFGGPGLEDDFQVLLEPAPALGVGRQEGVVMLGEGAPSDAEVEPSLADVVQSGDFLGDADGVAQRQQQHAQPDADALGASGDGRGHHDGGGQDAEGDEVVFGKPDGLGSEALGLFGHLETVLEGLLVGYVV